MSGFNFMPIVKGAGIVAEQKKKNPYEKYVDETQQKINTQWDENSENFKTTKNALLESLADAKKNITDDEDFKRVAKGVFDKFDYDSIVARDNAIAGGAADNGGNIDSYAAANAIRQQAALRSKGADAAINAGLGVVGQKRSDVMNFLSKLSGEDQAYFDRQQKNIETGMGATQQAFDINETEMNNRVDRDVKLTEASGYNSGLVKYSHNELFNQDGTLRNVDKDYKADYNAVVDALKSETNAEEIKKLKAYKNALAEAHNWKVINIPKYSDIPLLPVEKEGSLNRFLGESAEKVAMGEAAATENAARVKAESDWNKAVLDSQTKITTTQMDNDTDYAINERKIENDNSSSSSSSSNGTGKETKKSNTDSWLSKWLYSPWAIPTTEEQINNPESAGIFYNSWGAKTDDIYAARDKLNSKDGYAFCKQELLDAGFTNDQANKKIKEWKKNIAGLEAKRRGITTEEVLENWNWMIDDEVV